MRRAWAVVLAVALCAAGCVSIKFGRDFPSPDRQLIVVGKTDKATLERIFGEPYQIGLDSGDQTWRWFYGQRENNVELSKDLSVRFNADGIVKSYAFTSNFPDDMVRLR
jgi:outer membrane protein assembly factor BamE (lipoprotein component of BamABCDE complex)